VRGPRPAADPPRERDSPCASSGISSLSSCWVPSPSAASARPAASWPGPPRARPRPGRSARPLPGPAPTRPGPAGRCWTPAAACARPGASSAGGPGGLHRRRPSTLGQLLGADSVHQALVTTKYQDQVVGADRAAVDRVERLAGRWRRLPPSWPTRPSARSAAGPPGRMSGARPARARTTAPTWSWPPTAAPGWAATGEPGSVARRRPGRSGQPGPGRPGVLRPQHGDPGSIHHVGMYVGGGAMVEAPYSGARVRIASIGRGDFIGAVRPTG
jgi:hypothetical protein